MLSSNQGRETIAEEESQIQSLSPKDWILLLLAADDAAPISGKTVFVKELFVIGQEAIPQVETAFRFFPSRFGPYSSEFEPAVKELVRKGLIREVTVPAAVVTESEAKRSDFSLLPEGRRAAASLSAALPQDVTDKLNRYKKTLSSLGFWGLIQYVYASYPGYTVLSEMKGT